MVAAMEQPIPPAPTTVMAGVLPKAVRSFVMAVLNPKHLNVVVDNSGDSDSCFSVMFLSIWGKV